MKSGGDNKITLGGVLAIIGTVVLVMLVASAIPLSLKYLRGSDPKTARVDELIRRARTGEWERAYRCTEESFRRVVTRDQFQSRLEALPGFQAGGSHELEWSGYTSTRAGAVDARLKAVDGRGISVRFALYRPIMGNDFLITDIETGARSLFEGLLGK